MKLIGLMALSSFKRQIREIMERHHIHIYSEVEVTGHTAESARQFGWWHLEKDIPLYSTLYFAILAEEKADEIMSDVQKFVQENPSDHPPRAFQVAVEKMI